MSKTLIALALAAACGLGTTAAHAQSTDVTGWFVNAGVGTAHYHATVDNFDVGSDSHTSGQVNFGWRSHFIGVEAGYTNLGNVKGQLSAADLAGTGFTSGHNKLSGDGWTFGFNGHFNPTRMWYVSARTGLFLWKLHYHETDTAAGGTTRFSQSEQSGDWYAGVGTGVDFNRHMSLGVNFDYYKIAKHDVNIGNRVFTVNFEYRF